MESSYLTRGDPLAAAEAAPAAAPAPPGAECPCGLLWGVDLTGCATKKQARRAWHDALVALEAELDAHPGIRRVCIACVRPERFPQSVLVRLPAGAALKVHNDLERDRGRYLSTLVLDITDCDDPALLHERIVEALCTPAAWSDLTLEWQQVADTSIHEAWILNSL